jgi:general secretion pathway protein G
MLRTLSMVRIVFIRQPATTFRFQQVSCPQRQRAGRGFTLIELLMALAIVALLAAIAVPSYQSVIERQKVGVAVRDLAGIAMQIEKYRGIHFEPPESLHDVYAQIPQDPWGNDYEYLSFSSTQPGVKGKIRKDHNLHPLNSEFDLYSSGPDGKSVPPLTGAPSRDDVIWARDGGFIGTAADY